MSAVEVRLARAEDVPLVAAWTRDTFEWGDYVADRMPVWLDDPASHTVVCAEGGDVIGIANIAMLSPTEAWLEGARVHPDHRRRGIGSSINRAGLDWAKDRGARVARLAIVDSNAAARRQVEAMGYRLTSTWADTDLTPLQTPPTSLARGLQPAPSADVDAAWMSWVSGDLSRVGREMLAFGWRWRTATPPDLREAVRNQAFFQSPAGWAIVEYRQPTEWGIGWLSTTPDSAPELFDDILKTAREAGIERVRIKVPWIPWAVEALQRAGADPDPISVFSIRP